MNEASLILESSRMMGSGARIPLKFDAVVKVRGGSKGIGGMGLFPGAIVALRGKNGGGGWFLVEEILAVGSLCHVLPLSCANDLQMPPMRPSPISFGTGIKPEPGDSAFSMCIASGPFTSDADLNYKPWQTLYETLKTTKPAVLLLVNSFSFRLPSLMPHPLEIDWTLHRYSSPEYQKR